MDEKVIHTVRTIVSNLSGRLSRTKTKIINISISIQNGSMDTLQNIPEDLLKDFHSFNTSLHTLDVLNGRHGLDRDKKIKELQGIVKNMDIKIIYLKLAIAEGDFKALGVIVSNYTKDIDRFTDVMLRDTL